MLMPALWRKKKNAYICIHSCRHVIHVCYNIFMLSLWVQRSYKALYLNTFFWAHVHCAVHLPPSSTTCMQHSSLLFLLFVLNFFNFTDTCSSYNIITDGNKQPTSETFFKKKKKRIVLFLLVQTQFDVLKTSIQDIVSCFDSRQLHVCLLGNKDLFLLWMCILVTLARFKSMTNCLISEWKRLCVSIFHVRLKINYIFGRQQWESDSYCVLSWKI